MRVLTLALWMALNCISVIRAHSQVPSKPDLSPQILTTADMREIAWKEFTEADTQMNQVYKKLLARIANPNQKARLQTAQKAWLVFRDANAEFEAAFYDGGSIQPQIRTTSATSMTKKRTQELQHVLDTEFDR